MFIQITCFKNHNGSYKIQQYIDFHIYSMYLYICVHICMSYMYACLFSLGSEVRLISETQNRAKTKARELSFSCADRSTATYVHIYVHIIYIIINMYYYSNILHSRNSMVLRTMPNERYVNNAVRSNWQKFKIEMYLIKIKLNIHFQFKVHYI